MTTLTIQLPDSETEVIATISNIIKKAGGQIEIDNDDLEQSEFDQLQASYKEALMIKDGLAKGIPASDFLFTN